MDNQGGPILDVACGAGRFTIPLAEHGFDITGLDIVKVKKHISPEETEKQCRCLIKYSFYERGVSFLEGNASFYFAKDQFEGLTFLNFLSLPLFKI
ncbi:class I SAM-dependent methyltransferase [Sporosarcina sp. Marseille-Q4063]|uniref:class I SAM-dependent methyltransferase n=1 Tax=Sporosarcina sp. Marseille-Q4063 TaxID=2810514 RepID=UPI001BAF2445|nr:class I SAM-dependent methyltransferase [Sporosarcina sp. Marseille-Q4063]QUW23941.1 class I SAM-dependent methyltransferase [Sporosarcina sp. Marseille-Q4063]